MREYLNCLCSGLIRFDVGVKLLFQDGRRASCLHGESKRNTAISQTSPTSYQIPILPGLAFGIFKYLPLLGVQGSCIVICLEASFLLQPSRF